MAEFADFSPSPPRTPDTLWPAVVRPLTAYDVPADRTDEVWCVVNARNAGVP